MPEYYEPVVDAVAQGEENKLVNKALSKLPAPYISGLKLRADIQLWNPATETGLTLNTIDDNNIVWVVSDIDGWWTLPEMEIPDLPRGWGDGSYDAIGRWSNRILTLTGSFLTQEPEDAATARNTLMSYLAPMVKTQTAGYLIVDEADPSDSTKVVRRAAKVRLSGVPMITSVNARGRHDFSIGLKAVDPIKYEFVDGDPDGYQAVTISTSDLLGTGDVGKVITNIGNTSVPVIFEISDGFEPSGDATISNGDYDENIVIVGSTDTDVKLEIDTYNREVLDVDYSVVTVDNPDPGVTNARSKVSVLVDWIYLRPGDNTIILTGFPSGSSCTVYYRSGWIG